MTAQEPAALTESSPTEHPTKVPAEFLKDLVLCGTLSLWLVSDMVMMEGCKNKHAKDCEMFTI